MHRLTDVTREILPMYCFYLTPPYRCTHVFGKKLLEISSGSGGGGREGSPERVKEKGFEGKLQSRVRDKPPIF